MASKCKALFHGRAMCWPVKGLRTSGEGESDMYILKLLVGLLFGGTDPVSCLSALDRSVSRVGTTGVLD